MLNDFVFALSLCRKAGALVMGFDAVKDSVLRGKAQLVLCAADISEGTRRRVGTFCEDWVEVLDVPYTQFELSQVSKKLTAVFAVTDENLAALCRKKADAAQSR
jgi:ribosomal protein L7Ae-like RNA K-turn-binding protein